MYCAPVFYPLLSKKNEGRLDTIQLRAGRIIAGCVKAINWEAVLLEANSEPLHVYMDGACAVAAEKYRRMPKNDPLAIMTLSATSPSRLMRTAESWQHVSDIVFTACGLRIGRLTSVGNKMVPRDERVSNLVDVRNRAPIYSGIPPWDTANAYEVTYVTDLVKICKKTDPPELWKIETENTIAACGLHDIEVWSDGAVIDKQGAGAANTYDNDRNKMYSDAVPAGNLCSSYKAEIEGVLIG
jgi:hypothetical protein